MSKSGEVKKSCSDDDKTRSYFCSELIAKCFKKCKIIENTECSSLFYPGMFCSKQWMLNLNQGITVDPEAFIIEPRNNKVTLSEGAFDDDSFYNKAF